MGVVVEAEDVRLRRRVAVKRMLPDIAGRPEAKARFLREARAMAAVEDDRIVPVLYVGESADGVPFLVMPLLVGETLDTRLNRGPLTPAELVAVGRDAALGLAAAHARGLIHRDIKPSNLWLEAHPDGTFRRVRLLDFGLARPAHTETQMTTTGTVIGTPAYMSPEQARGNKVDARSDLFSLGSVLYRAATGRPPFPGDTTSAVLTALAVDDPIPVRRIDPALPPPLAALIHDLLRKAPGDRPTSDDVIRRLTAAAPVEPRRRPGRAILAGSLAALVVLAAGVIVVVRDKDGKVVASVPLPPGGTANTRDTDSGNERPVEPEKKIPPMADAGANRKAAEWVIGVGGFVRVNGEEQDRKATADLPKDRLTLAAVNLGGKKVSDAGLEHLKDLKGLTHLHLSNNPVSDEGLEYLKGLNSLSHLDLSGTRVSNEGLEHLKGLKGLSYLDLNGTRVSNAGLAHLKGLTALRYLQLNGTKVSGAGLEHLKGLTDLDLSGTRVSDAGLVHLKDLKGLTWLNLSGTTVSDAGLAHLKELKGLMILHLGGTTVSDAGLVHLMKLKSLGHLNLNDTTVSDSGLEHLKGLTALRNLNLNGTKVSGAGLVHLKDLDDLRNLELTGTKVSDAGLVHLKGLYDLTHLELSGTQVSDAGLVHLKDLDGLTHFNLNGTTVSDAGLAHLKELKGLKYIELNGTKVSDAGLPHFKDIKGLTVLDLGGTKVSDAGLTHLKGLTGLTDLYVKKTGVTAKGVEALHAVLPACKIHLDGSTIEPKK